MFAVNVEGEYVKNASIHNSGYAANVKAKITPHILKDGKWLIP